MSVAGTDEVVGRDDQVRAFERVLQAAQPAFVLVTGQVGSGKSRLLREMRARARAFGWRALPPPEEPGLVVTRDATPQSFSRHLQEMLADRAEGARIDARPVRDAHALARGIAASSNPRHPRDPVAGDETAASLIATMRDAGPAVVAVDGFRPNAAFARWLSDQLLPAARESGLPAIAVLTMEAEPPPEVLRYVDEHVHLGRLDEAATERYFRRLGERLSPPMGEEELRAYVREAAARPELVHSLRRVLALAERPGR